MSRELSACIAILFLISLVAHVPSAGAAAGDTGYISSTTISIYEDGSATIDQNLTVPQNITSISIPLFSSQVGNILVIDQNDRPLSYDIGNQSITIYTLGASAISLAYDTETLTTKQGSVWNVTLSTSYDVSLVLPYEATILYVSASPVSVSSQDGSPELVLGSGAWTVSYGLPITVSETTSSTSVSSATSSASGTVRTVQSSTSSLQSSSSTVGGTSARSELPYLAIPLVAVALAAVAYYAVRRRGRSESRTLRHDDIEMLRFVKESGGEVSEGAVREHFGLPRTSAWRQAKRLEAMGYLKITKTGSQNQLKLLRADFETP